MVLYKDLGEQAVPAYAAAIKSGFFQPSLQPVITCQSNVIAANYNQPPQYHLSQLKPATTISFKPVKTSQHNIIAAS